MIGDLLFDVTGSDVPVDGSWPQGSRLQIRRGSGPGGGSALFAFTRNEEIARVNPPGTRTQSLVTSAVGAMELALHHRDAWLYIDPAGPTCALSASEMDFALRNPRNDPLKMAVADLHAGRIQRPTILEVLRSDGSMLMAADETTIPGKIGFRSVTLRDGSAALIGCSSAAEVVAFNPADAVTVLTTLKVVDEVLKNGYAGLMVNPAGPFVFFPSSELAAQQWV